MLRKKPCSKCGKPSCQKVRDCKREPINGAMVITSFTKWEFNCENHRRDSIYIDIV
jgi:hypothetical protein